MDSDSFMQSLHAKAKVLKGQSQDAFTAEGWSNLGTEAMQQGYFAEAEKYYRRSIGIIVPISGENSVDAALATVPLAQLLGTYKQMFDESITMLERSLDILHVEFDNSKDGSEEHPAITETRDILDYIYSLAANLSPVQSRPTTRERTAPSSLENPIAFDYSENAPNAQPLNPPLHDWSAMDDVSVLSEEESVGGDNRSVGSTHPPSTSHNHAAFPHSEPSCFQPLIEVPSKCPPGVATSFALLISSRPGSPGPLSTQNPNPVEPPLEPLLEPHTFIPIPIPTAPALATSISYPAADDVLALASTFDATTSDAALEQGTDKAADVLETAALHTDTPPTHKHKHKHHKQKHHKNDDVGDENSDDMGDLAAPMPTTAVKNEMFPVETVTFTEDSTRLAFSVDYLHIPAHLREVMCRSNDDAYVASVGKQHSLPLFPPQLVTGGRYKPEYVQCARFVMSTRVRRLLLEDSLRDLVDKNKQYIDLLETCHQKKAAIWDRLLSLENEMEHIAESKQGHLVSAGSRLGAYLSTRPGWVVIFEYLSRECRRLQLSEEKRANGGGAGVGEEVCEHMTLDRVLKAWDLLQVWQLLHSVFFRCHSGVRGYPIAARAPEGGQPPEQPIESTKSKTPKKGGSRGSMRSGSIESDRTSGSTQALDLPSAPIPDPVTASDPTSSILAGVAAGAAAESDPYDKTAQIPEDFMDDNSSIATLPTVKEGALDDASVGSAGNGVLTKPITGASKIEPVVSSAPAPADQEKKSGWGFSFNLFGKKEEAIVEEAVAPTVVTLQSIVQGYGLGEWGEVCDALGCQGKYSLLDAANQIVNVLRSIKRASDVVVCPPRTDPETPDLPPTPLPLGHNLHGIVPPILCNDIQIALEGMSTRDETNPFLHASLKHVIDCISDHVESLLIDGLRLYPGWGKALEVCRKDRLRRTGGRLDQSAQGEVEIDKHGAIRIIPNADDIIDTDVLHGSRQRIQVSIVMPELERRISMSTGLEMAVQGELACVVQFGYLQAAPLLQRAIRGTLARMRKDIVRRDLVLYAMHAAAFTIQGKIRSVLGRQNFAKSKAEFIGDAADTMARKLQRQIRGWTKRHAFLQYKEKKRYRLWWFGLTKMQAIIRGYNSRHRVRRLRAGHRDDRQEEEKLWQAELIQRVARGYIARKTIVRSLRLRMTISKKVLVLAEKYLQKGNLWEFLKQIDDEFARLGKEINATKEREDEFADTFIEKVLAKRQGEFDSAWDTFGRAVTSNGAAGSSNQLTASPGKIEQMSGQRGQAETILSVTGASGNAFLPSQAGGGVGTGMHRTGSPSAVPGPLLRRAISATVQEGVASEVKRQRDGQERGVKLQETIGKAYGIDSPGNKTGKSGRKMAASKSLGALASMSQTLPPTAVSKDVEMAIRVKQKKKKGKPQPNNMTAVTGNFLATAARSVGYIPTTRAVSAISPSPDHKTDSGWSLETILTPGHSLLVDIPKGINDTMERLLRATALRCYVPEFFTSSTPEEAYRMYLVLPDGLAKMRYEQEAYRYCQPAITALRVKGVNLIADCMPPKRVKQFLLSVNTPSPLLSLAMNHLHTLVKMGDIPIGLNHANTGARQAVLMEGKGTLIDAIAAGVASKNMNHTMGKTHTENEQSKSGIRNPVSGSDRESVNRPQSPGTISPTAIASPVHFNETPSDLDLLAELGLDHTLANRLLVDMVEGGQWASLKASCDDILMHAANLCIPYVVKRSDKYGAVIEQSTDWGHSAFKAHIRACQVAAAGGSALSTTAQSPIGKQTETSSEDRRRELVRERFRACLLLTTPFSLRLKADGMLTVQDLIEHRNLRALQMPAALLDQLEALLGTALSLSVSSKVVPTVRDHLATSGEIFTVPMIFDPKFQRGPFDPYGRAPRIFPRLKPKLTKPDKRPQGGDTAASATTATTSSDPSGRPNPNESKTADDDDDMPLTLWETKKVKHSNTKAEQRTRKLFSFQTDHQRREHADQESVGIGAVIPSTQPVAGAGQSYSDLQAATNPAPTTPSQREMHQKARLYSQNFEAKIRSGFERPYKCSHPGCDAAFSRAYSLSVHEKSHALFGGYHEFRSQPQVFLDDDHAAWQARRKAAYEASISLPPLVQNEIVALREAAAARAWALTYEEQEELEKLKNAPSRPTTAMVYGEDLVYPHNTAPAARYLEREGLVSRDGVTSADRSGSPWRLPKRGESMGSSRGASRGSSRGGSRGGLGGSSSRGRANEGVAVTPWDNPQTPSSPSAPGSATSLGFPTSPFPGSFSPPSPLSSPQPLRGSLSRGSLSRGGASPSRGNVTFLLDGDTKDEEDSFILSTPPIRFGKRLAATPEGRTRHEDPFASAYDEA